MSSGTQSPDEVVDRFLDEVERRTEAGEEVDVASLARTLGMSEADIDALGLAVEALTQLGPDTEPEFRPPPRRLGPYELQDELARGGMGVVYRARHVQLGRVVALKVLQVGEGANERQRERFELEARAAARLRHAHIVAIHDVGEVDGLPYLVLDLIEGESLEARVRRDTLEPRAAAEIVAKIADALHYAHDHLILHRDVKPANVLLTREGEPLLTDFGLAKVLDNKAQGPTLAGHVVGTPSYMSPEQAAGKLLDRRADVYSLGGTFYTLLTGLPPFSGESVLEVLARVAGEEPVPPRRIRPGVNADLETICLKCLEKDPDRRYETAKSLADDLERFLRDEPIRARPPSLVDRLAKWSRRNRTASRVVVAATVVVVGLGGSGAVWVARAREQAQTVAREQARSLSIAKARRAAQAAWSRLGEATDEGPDARTALALRALQTAQRWHDLEPEARQSARAQFDAAKALGEVALASEQWALAAEAYLQAEGLGVDDAGARAARSKVHDVRRQEAERQKLEVQDLLQRVERGEVGEEGLVDAVFQMVRMTEHEQTANLLVDRLEATTIRMAEVEREVFMAAAESERGDVARPELTTGLSATLDRKASLRPGETLSQRDDALIRWAASRLEHRAKRRLTLPGSRPPDNLPTIVDLIGQRQGIVVGRGALDVVRVCCEVLGRLGHTDARTIDALGRYLEAESDPLRAVPAAVALARLGGERGLMAIHQARGKFGPGLFDARVSRALAGRKELLPLDPLLSPGLAYVKRGEALAKQGNLQGAVEDLTRAIELEPKLAKVYSTRAMILMKMGAKAEALSDHERAIELNPKWADAWGARGSTYLLLGDLVAAEADLNKALELSPDSATALINLANVKILSGRLGDALAYAERATRLDPRFPQAWATQGNIRDQLGDHEPAMRDLERALELDPRDPLTWTNLGNARLRMKDPRGAVEAYDEALVYDPNYALAWSNRASALLLLNDLHGAVADANRAMEADPGIGDPYSHRGRARLKLGDIPGALEDLERAIELAPTRSRAWFERAKVRKQLKDNEGAIADYTKVLELDPAFKSAWMNRGNVFSGLKRHAEAAADFSQALRLDPNFHDARTNRGLSYKALGRTDEALADFSEVLRRDPSDTYAWANRGLLRAALGDVDGGIDDLESYLRLEPKGSRADYARTVLARLEQQKARGR